MIGQMNRLRVVAGLLAALMVSGCASWMMKGEPPEVLVTNVTPLEASAFEQRLQVDLRIRNPNDFDLAVTGIDFRLDLNGNRLARGLGNKELVVPRLSDAVTSVETSTSTLQVVRQLLSFSGNQSLTYHLTGVVHTKEGRLPFDSSGVLLEKGALSGSPAAQ
ncbi:MAG: WHy domain-containing protein [Nitrospira sp.]|nr:MAG: WHy domain-containing protein [Nitrospira sp.]